MAEISEIIAKEAIEGILKADRALTSLDTTIQKIITQSQQLNGAMGGNSFREYESVTKRVKVAAENLNQAQKQRIQVEKELQREQKKAADQQAKLIEKQRQHNEALNLSVKSVGDAKRQLAALTVERDKASTSLGRQSKEVRELNARMQQNTEFIRANGTAADKQRMNIGNYASALKGLGGMLAATFSATAIIGFGRAAFRAYEDQIQANKRLMFALNGNKQAFKELTAQASQLQSATGVGEEEIQQIQMLAISAGNSTEAVKMLVQASLALSSATGIDLQAAYLQLSGTLNGVAGKLIPKLGVDFKGLTKEQLMNGDVINLLIKNYGNLAEQSSVATRQLKANWGELMERIGAGVATVVSPALEYLNDLFSSSEEKERKGLNFFGIQKRNSLNGKTWAQYKKDLEQQKKEVTQTAVTFKSSSEQIADAKEKEAAAIAKATERQKTAIELLTDKITLLRSELENALLTTGEAPDGLIRQLLGSEAELKRVQDQVKSLTSDIVDLASKGIQPLTGGSTGGNTGLLTPRAPGATGAPTGTEGGLLSGITSAEWKDMAISAASQTSDEIFNIISQKDQEAFDKKMNLLEKEKEAKLKNANLTEKQKAKIESDYEKKAAKVKEEAFKKKKAADFIQSLINTALAVTNALASGGPAAPALAIAAGITGAIQSAFIAAQPVPQFDAGAAYTPKNFIAGERRPEWMKTPSGQWRYVDRPTMFKNMAGATVIGGAQTERLMKAGIHPANDIRPEINAMRTDIVEAIKGKKELSITASGSKITQREGNYNKQYFNRFVQWAGKN